VGDKGVGVFFEDDIGDAVWARSFVGFELRDDLEDAAFGKEVKARERAGVVVKEWD
jgi:hypothetical protein